VDSLRVAVLAALNLADELSQALGKTAGAEVRSARARAANLRGLLDQVLEDERKTGS
jgi:cell division protein ZapA